MGSGRGAAHGRSLCRHGLGRRLSVGVNGAMGVRFRRPLEGSDVTTSGSSRLFSACSIAPCNARDSGDLNDSMGAEKTRLASPPQVAHAIDSGAVPSGPLNSSSP